MRAARHAAVDDSTRTTWVQAHYDALHEATTALLAAADRHAINDRDWLDELATDHDAVRYTPASMVLLGLAAAEVRTSPAVTRLDTAHPVHRCLAAIERLRTAFARLS